MRIWPLGPAVPTGLPFRVICNAPALPVRRRISPTASTVLVRLGSNVIVITSLPSAHARTQVGSLAVIEACSVVAAAVEAAVPASCGAEVFTAGWAIGRGAERRLFCHHT